MIEEDKEIAKNMIMRGSDLVLEKFPNLSNRDALTISIALLSGIVSEFHKRKSISKTIEAIEAPLGELLRIGVIAEKLFQKKLLN